MKSLGSSLTLSLTAQVLSSLVAFQAHARSPMPPAIPTEAFAYSCQMEIYNNNDRPDFALTWNKGGQTTSLADFEISSSGGFLGRPTYFIKSTDLQFARVSRPYYQRSTVEQTPSKADLRINYDMPRNGQTQMSLYLTLDSDSPDGSVRGGSSASKTVALNQENEFELSARVSHSMVNEPTWFNTTRVTVKCTKK